MRRWQVPAVMFALVAVCTAPAHAHPLGNFTINHMVVVSERARSLEVRYVLDMAEIPTFEVMRARNTSGRLDAAGLRAWARAEAVVIAPALDIEIDGTRTALRAGRSEVTTRAGAGGLPTLYWAQTYHAPLPQRPARISVRDDSFGDRIGWKDVVVAGQADPTDELRHYPNALLGSPRAVTSAEIVLTPSGLRAVAVAPASVPDATAASLIRSNALSDILARGTSDPLIVAFTLILAVGLGALHAAEPGHGKTLLAVSLVGARATRAQAVLLAIGLTIAHTAGVLLLGAVLIVAARWIVPEAIYPWITALSGAAVAVLGASALARRVRGWRAAAHHHVAHDHAHPHDHGHSHGHRHPPLTVDGGVLSFRAVLLIAMGGNLAPCPAALVVLLAALALHQVVYGLVVVVAFSLGLALVLTGLGVALVHGAAWLADRPAFDRLSRHAPLASACAISVMGAVMLGQGAAAGAFAAPPAAVTALALTAIAAFALLPGHSHAEAAS